MLLKTLLAIYIGLMSINVVFMLSLHFLHDRKGYYKLAMWAWLGLVLGYLADGLVAAHFGPVTHLFGIPVMAITIYSLARLACAIYKFKMPLRQLAVFSFGAWALGITLHFVFHATFAMSSLPVCIGMALPVIWAGSMILFTVKRKTIIDGMFSILLIAEGVHILDYPFLRNIESAAVFGFSLGLIIVYFASMLIPVVINRRLSADFNDALQKEVDAKTERLELSLNQLSITQSQLIQSSKLAALGEMAGGVAHEINTPLAVISMRSRHLKRLFTLQPFDVEQAGKIVETIQLTTDRIAKIIHGLNVFSRDSSRDPFVPYSLTTIIEDTMQLCAQKISDHDIDISLNGRIDIQLTCRPEQISQVLVNIINNAVDAICSLDKKWIKIDVVERDGNCSVYITDSGLGISTETEQKLFQPFFTTKPIGKGTGLGLSISKGIVEAHGGNIRINRDSPNTCFIVEFARVSVVKTAPVATTAGLSD